MSVFFVGFKIKTVKLLCVELLWGSLVVEVASLICRIYQVYEVTAEYSLLDLEPSLQFVTTICYLCLVVFDGICIHKEVSGLASLGHINY